MNKLASSHATKPIFVVSIKKVDMMLCGIPASATILGILITGNFLEPLLAPTHKLTADVGTYLDKIITTLVPDCSCD